LALRQPATFPDYSLENDAIESGATYVCGIDEAGRGPLAGPVFAAAVVLRPGTEIPGLNDSKKLSEKKREQLFDVIIENAEDFFIATATEKEIDELDILHATYLAMNRAVHGLKGKADMALVDGNRDPGLGIKTQTVVKGDSKSMSIAAASILAKVSRDRYMLELDKLYPEYQFAKHKGYGSLLHYEMLMEHGPSEVHRASFLKPDSLEKNFERVRKSKENKA